MGHKEKENSPCPLFSPCVPRWDNSQLLQREEMVCVREGRNIIDGGLTYEMKFCVTDKKVLICRLATPVLVESASSGLDAD